MAKRPTVDLQLRGVPAELRDRLRKRASSRGLSMSRYAIDVLLNELRRPTLAEWLEVVRSDPPVRGVPSSPEMVREGRRERVRDIDRWLSSSTRRRR